MSACDHVVQFYDSEHELAGTVVPYLSAGLEAGEAVLVIATESHRLAFQQRLAALGTRFDEALAAGTYVAVDAAEIMRYIRPEGEAEPGAEEFNATVGMLVRNQLAGGRRLRVYGEVVALLSEDGDVGCALAVEELWDELRAEASFTLFCGYPGPRSAEQLDAVARVCRSHSEVLPAITQTDAAPDGAPISAVFSPTVDSPSRVRVLSRRALRDRRLDDDLIERATLAASELAANAVLHAHTSFRLLVRPSPASVWVGVEDGAPLDDHHAVVGRMPHGLGMIATLALRWGVQAESGGKIVWAEIPR